MRIFNGMKNSKTSGSIKINNESENVYYPMLDESYNEDEVTRIENGLLKTNELDYCKVQTILIK